MHSPCKASGQVCFSVSKKVCCSEHLKHFFLFLPVWTYPSIFQRLMCKPLRESMQATKSNSGLVGAAMDLGQPHCADSGGRFRVHRAQGWGQHRFCLLLGMPPHANKDPRGRKHQASEDRSRDIRAPGVNLMTMTLILDWGPDTHRGRPNMLPSNTTHTVFLPNNLRERCVTLFYHKDPKSRAVTGQRWTSERRVQAPPVTYHTCSQYLPHRDAQPQGLPASGPIQWHSLSLAILLSLLLCVEAQLDGE